MTMMLREGMLHEGTMLCEETMLYEEVTMRREDAA